MKDPTLLGEGGGLALGPYPSGGGVEGSDPGPYPPGGGGSDPDTYIYLRVRGSRPSSLRVGLVLYESTDYCI